MTSDLPLVTALINTYNYGRYLPFAINSVLAQTYPHLDILVVDDGSTDHTSDVLKQYGSRVRVIRTRNGGQGHAFNVGIPASKGDLIMLLDADDTWLPTKVERMVEEARQRPKAAMLYHRFQNIDNQGRELALPQPFTLTNGDYRENYLKSGGSWWSPITSVLAFRPDHIKRALPLPTYAVREGADTLLTDFCAVTTQIASIPDCLTLRLLHGANLYASGRDDRIYRTREIRESDVRRIEWRMFALQQVLRRAGHDLDINLDRHEWRMTNLYWLGRAPFLKVMLASLLSPEHSLKYRWKRLQWVRSNKALYRGE